MRITYLDENMEPTGQRTCRGEDAVVDQVLSSFDVPATIELDVTLRYVGEPEIINLLDHLQAGKEIDPWHLDLKVDVPQIHIESMWFPFNLYYSSIEKKKKKLAVLLGTELKEVKGYVDLARGQGIFGWVNMDSPFFFVSRPIDVNFTYKNLTQLAQSLDSWIADIVDEVLRLSHGVESCKPPDYEEDRLSVFMCHSSRDKAFARKLRTSLSQKSVNVWLDEDKISVGEDFVTQLEKGITESDFVAVVLSPNFVKYGPWAKEEFRIALSEQIEKGTIRILPVLKKDCQIPQILKTKHYADFRRNFDEGLKKLVMSMRRLKARSREKYQ